MLNHHNKTKLIGSMHKMKYNDKLNVEINGTDIENVVEQTLLGVYIDRFLNWETHIYHRLVLQTVCTLAQ